MTNHDRDPRIHPYIFKSIGLPFHTQGKPFGMTQAEWDEKKDEYFSETYQAFPPAPPVYIGTVSLYPQDTDVNCECGLQAVYHMRNKAYCTGCWANGDDEDA